MFKLYRIKDLLSKYTWSIFEYCAMFSGGRRRDSIIEGSFTRVTSPGCIACEYLCFLFLEAEQEEETGDAMQTWNEGVLTLISG